MKIVCIIYRQDHVIKQAFVRAEWADKLYNPDADIIAKVREVKRRSMYYGEEQLSRFFARFHQMPIAECGIPYASVWYEP